MKKSIVLFTAIAFFMITVQSLSAHPLDSYTFMTEQNAPFNFEEAGKKQGFSIEILDLLLKTVGSKKTAADIEFLPWARALRNLERKDKHVLFATARTPSREKLFKWVGPISPVTFGLIARKSANIKVNSIADANKYKVGSIRDTAGEKLALKAGLKESQLERVADNNANIKKLDRNRIQLWTYGYQVAKWTMKKNGRNPADYEIVYKLKELDLYYAFNKNTPDSLIKELQAAMDGLIQKGKVKQIVDKYQK